MKRALEGCNTDQDACQRKGSRWRRRIAGMINHKQEQESHFVKDVYPKSKGKPPYKRSHLEREKVFLVRSPTTTLSRILSKISSFSIVHILLVPRHNHGHLKIQTSTGESSSTVPASLSHSSNSFIARSDINNL